jgi:hypothetical protein
MSDTLRRIEAAVARIVAGQGVDTLTAVLEARAAWRKLCAREGCGIWYGPKANKGPHCKEFVRQRYCCPGCALIDSRPKRIASIAAGRAMKAAAAEETAKPALALVKRSPSEETKAALAAALGRTAPAPDQEARDAASGFISKLGHQRRRNGARHIGSRS